MLKTLLTRLPHRGALTGGALAAGLALAGPLVEAAPQLDPPRKYWTGGDSVVTVNGPHCCGGTRFVGHFDAAYQIDSSGHVALATLGLRLADTDVVVFDGFLGLFNQHITLRCTTALTSDPAAGAVNPAGELEFPPGGLRITGLSAEGRLADGTCGNLTLHLEASNDVPAKFQHDPAGNHFRLGGSFRATIGGDSYVLAVRLDGQYLDRPPQAFAAAITPENPQGGCPARPWWDGQQWLPVAEANDPAGLLAAPYSMSTDPDGAWGHNDIFNERWFLATGTAPWAYLGQGTLLPARTFGWGDEHRLAVVASDHAGATAASVCRFQVMDTRPPVVSPPPPLVTSCTQPGGVSSSTSGPLRNFLAGASARDASDPAPAALPPQVGGADVTASTLFAVNTTSTVSFRYRDRWSNLGSASSTVRVIDTVPPGLTLTLTPASLPASYKFYWITASLTVSDDCGGPVVLKLASITSNAPSYDAGDILDASFGTDDRGFYLFARPAGLGLPRIYKVVYEGRDAAGNLRQVATKVVVG